MLLAARRFTRPSGFKTRTKIDRVIGAVHAARHYAIYTATGLRNVTESGLGRSGKRRRQRRGFQACLFTMREASIDWIAVTIAQS